MAFWPRCGAGPVRLLVERCDRGLLLSMKLVGFHRVGTRSGRAQPLNMRGGRPTLYDVLTQRASPMVLYPFLIFKSALTA